MKFKDIEIGKPFMIVMNGEISNQTFIKVNRSICKKNKQRFNAVKISNELKFIEFNENINCLPARILIETTVNEEGIKK